MDRSQTEYFGFTKDSALKSVERLLIQLGRITTDRFFLVFFMQKCIFWFCRQFFVTYNWHDSITYNKIMREMRENCGFFTKSPTAQQHEFSCIFFCCLRAVNFFRQIVDWWIIEKLQLHTSEFIINYELWCSYLSG